MLNGQVFPSGAHVELSPVYQLYILMTLRGAHEAALLRGANILGVLGRMETALAWMIMPDGVLAPIGDTHPHKINYSTLKSILFTNPQLVYLVSGGRFGYPPASGVRNYSDAGYAFIRCELSG